MKKKFLALGLAAALVISLAGCGAEKRPLDEATDWQQFTVASLSSTDSLGRSFAPVGAFKEEKYVGIFYLTLHNSPEAGIYDISKLEQTEEGRAALWNPEGTPASPINATHYWGEPLFGYYNSEDEWVMRKHIEMLTMAHIDFLFLDATNGFTYDSVWRKLLPILDEYIRDGWDVPQVVFYCNAQSVHSIEHLYDVLYSKKYYPDTWFAPHGKPLLIAAKSDSVYGPGYENNVSQEILDFFEIKNAQWPTDPQVENALPWIDLTYPQVDYDGAVSVSVIQHPNMPVSTSVYFKEDPARYNSNFGRGYSRTDALNNPDRIMEGSNFEEQWEGVGILEQLRAMNSQPELEYIMVTGWNEWCVGKSAGSDAGVQFVDQMNLEFSRDIEPMKGGYGDNYYLQMIRNMRTYTTQSEYVPYNFPVPKSFGLYLSDKYWGEYGLTFKDMKNDTLPRDHIGFSKDVYYTNHTGRNDIVSTRVVNDSENLYFLIETREEIILDRTDVNCMNIWLDTREGGWEGYDFVVNRFIGENGVTSLERAVGDEYSFEKVADVSYAVAANRMVVSIPLSAIGVGQEFSLKFKVADNVTNPSDIMDYYVNGDSAPIGRLNYYYEYVK